MCHRAVVSQAHCMVCVSQGRSVTAVLCVTGPLCHRAVVSQAHCMVCVSQGRSVTALKASFIGLLLQYWLILKTRNFYFLSLYLAQFIDFIGGYPNPNPNSNPNPNPMTQRPYDTEIL